MAEKLKVSRATLIGGNTDGKNLFLEVAVFDGEHNNVVKPVFPFGTKAEEVVAYMKKIIEDNPKFPDDLSTLMQQTLYWDALEESWYMQTGNGKPVREKEKHATGTTHVPATGVHASTTTTTHTAVPKKP